MAAAAAAAPVPFSPTKVAANLSQKLLKSVGDKIFAKVKDKTANYILGLIGLGGGGKGEDPFALVNQKLDEILEGQKQLKAAQEAMMVSIKWIVPKILGAEAEGNILALTDRLKHLQRDNEEARKVNIVPLRYNIENTVLNNLRTIHTIVAGSSSAIDGGMEPQESVLKLWCQHCSKMRDENPNMSWLAYRDHVQSYLANVLYLQLLGVNLLIFHYTTRAEPSEGDLLMIQECYDRLGIQIDLYRALVPESVDFLADVLGAGKTAYLKVARPVESTIPSQDTYLRVGYGPNNTDIRDNRRSRTNGVHSFEGHRSSMHLYNPLYTDTEPYAWAITLVSGRSFRLEPVEHPGKPLTRFAIAENMKRFSPYRIHAGAIMDPTKYIPYEEISIYGGRNNNPLSMKVVQELNKSLKARSSVALFKFEPYSIKKEKFDKGEVSYKDGNLIAANLYPEERGRVRVADVDWDRLVLDNQHPFKHDAYYGVNNSGLFDIVLVEPEAVKVKEVEVGDVEVREAEVAVA